MLANGRVHGRKLQDAERLPPVALAGECRGRRPPGRASAAVRRAKIVPYIHQYFESDPARYRVLWVLMQQLSARNMLERLERHARASGND